MSSDASLAGRRIGVPESRQLDLFTRMLEARGAAVLRCPLVAIHDAPEATPVHAWIDEVKQAGLDEMIWLTGEGVRRLDGFAERHLGDDAPRFWQKLAGARHITRGPKPVRELKPRGIGSTIPAIAPTSAGVIESMAPLDLAGHRVGVQLYGSEPNLALQDALTAAGARVLPVAPYVYADAADDARVADFIQAIVTGQLDAVAFTSSPQIKRLFQIAGQRAQTEALTAALQRLCIAAVGPLVADALQQHGLAADLLPDKNYFMKPLVRRLVAHFDPDHSA